MGDHCTMCAPVPRTQWWQQRLLNVPSLPQGHMDEDVQRLLCQILKMQRLQEQGR